MEGRPVAVLLPISRTNVDKNLVLTLENPDLDFGGNDCIFAIAKGRYPIAAGYLPSFYPKLRAKRCKI